MLTLQRGSTAVTNSSSSTSSSKCRSCAARAGATRIPQLGSRLSLSSGCVPAPAGGVAPRCRPAGLVHHQKQQRRLAVALPALKDEQAEIDRIAREADSGSDVWSNEVVSTLVKVFLGGALVGVVVLLAYLARPMYDNTIKSFPTPAEYEQYEKREAESQGF